jgi:phosphate:Na+ symporter
MEEKRKLKVYVETSVISNLTARPSHNPVDAAMQIEPLEEVTDDMVNALHDLHLERLRKGTCSVDVGSSFLNLLSDLERISDVCSNVGVATLTRVNTNLESRAHEFISSLHSGHDETFNERYSAAHKEFFNKLDAKEA